MNFHPIDRRRFLALTGFGAAALPLLGPSAWPPPRPEARSASAWRRTSRSLTR